MPAEREMQSSDHLCVVWIPRGQNPADAGMIPSMQQPLTPSAVQRVGNELAIAWTDGAESFFPLEGLRRACPCAACVGEPDVTGAVVRPDVRYGAGSFELLGWQFIGGYALQPKWGDGHSTGLYSYAYLRRLAGA